MASRAAGRSTASDRAKSGSRTVRQASSAPASPPARRARRSQGRKGGRGRRHLESRGRRLSPLRGRPRAPAGRRRGRSRGRSSPPPRSRARRRAASGASAACAFCSTRSTVVPSALIASIASKIAWTTSGARPSDGSSSSSTLGSGHQRARDREHLLLAARERAAALRDRSFRRGKSAKTFSRSAARFWRSRRRIRAHLEVLGHRQVRRRRPSLRGRGRAPRDQRVGRRPVDPVRPKRRTSPAEGRTSPMIARSVVDLPAPLAPISVTISPARTASETPFRRVIAP